MGFDYKLNSGKVDKVSSASLLTCHTLSAVLSVFVSTFLVAYIYDFSTDVYNYVFNVAVYYIAIYVVMLATYWFFALIVDKTNRVWVYRFGLLLRVILVVVLVFFGKDLSKLLILAGALYGLSEGAYYSSYNVLKHEMVGRKSMGGYSVFSHVSRKIVEIIAPIALGALIEISTYVQVSIYVAVVGLAIIVVSFWIRSQKPDSSDYSLRSYLKQLKVKNTYTDRIKYMYKATLCYGVVSTVSPLLNICIMLQFGSSLSLGWIVGTIGIISVIEILLIKRHTVAGRRNWMYFSLAVFPVLGSVLFVLLPSVTTVILFNVCIGFVSIVTNTTYDTYRNANLKEAGLYSGISEHQTIIESVMNIARIIAFVIMLGISLIGNQIVLYVLFVIYSMSHTGVMFLMYFYEKKYINHDRTKKECLRLRYQPRLRKK